MTHETTEPVLEPYLETYHFYKENWDDYDELYETFEWEVPEQFNLATYLCDRWADAEPDRVAMYAVESDGTETEYTYGQLHTDANRLANYLAAQGIERGDRIALNGAQKIEFPVAYIAAWKLGAITVPLSLRLGPDGLRHRLEDGGVTACVIDEASLGPLRKIKDDCDDLEMVFPVGDKPTEADEVEFWSAIEEQSARFETATTNAEEPAMILYTSGTTGPPKGVVHPHRSLLGVLPGIVTSLCNMEIREGDVLHTPVEWSWAGSLFGGILSTLYYGIPVVGDADPQFDPESSFDLLDRYNVTIIGAPATVYRMLIQVQEPGERYDLSSLRVAFQGGEALGQTIVDWIRETIGDIAIHEVYGQTESAAAGVGDCEALGVAHREGHMGKPMPGHEVRVFSLDDTEPVESGNLGELALRYKGNPASFTEFWNAPEKTAERIRDGWLLTEDVGSVDKDGYVSFHSRKDDVIISSGYRIGPDEIEESLAEHEAVGNAGVIGVPDDTRGEVPKAFVVLAVDSEPTDGLELELQDHVKSRLAMHEYPRELEFVEELPKTTTGKVRRHDLRKREGLVE